MSYQVVGMSLYNPNGVTSTTFTGTVVLHDGQNSTMVNLYPEVNGPQSFVGDKSLTMTILPDPAYTVGTPSTAKITIVLPTVTVTAVASSFNWGENLEFTISRGSSTWGNMVVYYNGSGMSSYSGIGLGWATIPAGQNSVTVAFALVGRATNDDSFTGPNSLTITLVPPPTGTAYYTIGTPSTATTTVILETVTVAAQASVVNLGDPVYFTVARSPISALRSLSVLYKVTGLGPYVTSGTAVIPAGASQTTVKVTPVSDPVGPGELSGPPSVTLSVVQPVGKNGGYNIGTPGSATTTINLPTVTVAADYGSVGLGYPAVFTFTRNMSVGALTVFFTASGMSGYVIGPGSVTIPDGETSVQVGIPAVSNVWGPLDGFNGPPSVTVAIASASGGEEGLYKIGTPSSATMGINLPVLTVMPVASPVNFGSLTSFTVSRGSSMLAGTLNFGYGIGGFFFSALELSNWSILPGQSSVEISVDPTAVGDQPDLVTNTVILQLLTPTPLNGGRPYYTIGLPQATVVVTLPIVQVSAPAASVNLGDPVSFVFTRSNVNLAEPLTLYYSVSGNSAYSGLGDKSITFAAGQAQTGITLLPVSPFNPDPLSPLVVAATITSDTFPALSGNTPYVLGPPFSVGVTLKAPAPTQAQLDAKTKALAYYLSLYNNELWTGQISQPTHTGKINEILDYLSAGDAGLRSALQQKAQLMILTLSQQKVLDVVARALGNPAYTWTAGDLALAQSLLPQLPPCAWGDLAPIDPATYLSQLTAVLKPYYATLQSYGVQLDQNGNWNLSNALLPPIAFTGANGPTLTTAVALFFGGDAAKALADPNRTQLVILAGDWVVLLPGINTTAMTRADYKTAVTNLVDRFNTNFQTWLQQIQQANTWYRAATGTSWLSWLFDNGPAAVDTSQSPAQILANGTYQTMLNILDLLRFYAIPAQEMVNLRNMLHEGNNFESAAIDALGKTCDRITYACAAAVAIPIVIYAAPALGAMIGMNPGTYTSFALASGTQISSMTAASSTLALFALGTGQVLSLSGAAIDMNFNNADFVSNYVNNLANYGTSSMIAAPMLAAIPPAMAVTASAAGAAGLFGFGASYQATASAAYTLGNYLLANGFIGYMGYQGSATIANALATLDQAKQIGINNPTPDQLVQVDQLKQQAYHQFLEGGVDVGFALLGTGLTVTALTKMTTLSPRCSALEATALNPPPPPDTNLPELPDFIRAPDQTSISWWRLFVRSIYLMPGGPILTPDPIYVDNQTRALDVFMRWLFGLDQTTFVDMLKNAHRAALTNVNYRTGLSTINDPKEVPAGVLRNDPAAGTKVFDHPIVKSELTQAQALGQNLNQNPQPITGTDGVPGTRYTWKTRLNGIPDAAQPVNTRMEFPTDPNAAPGPAGTHQAPPASVLQTYLDAMATLMADIKASLPRAQAGDMVARQTVVDLLSDYYQAGVNAHPFMGINNSILGGQVNGVLMSIGLEGIELGRLDLLGYIVDGPVFRIQFNTTIRAQGGNANLLP